MPAVSDSDKSVQWLFIRWLLVFGAIALLIGYLRSDDRDRGMDGSYETSRSSGASVRRACPWPGSVLILRVATFTP